VTINVLSNESTMSLYRAIYTKIRRLFHFRNYQKIDHRNQHVRDWIDRMDNEEHQSNSNESVYSRDRKSRDLRLISLSYRIFFD